MSTFCNYWNKVSLVKSKIKKSKKIDSIGIGLASPEEIRRWGERQLPNGTLIGKVDKDHTVDYESLKPIEGGLFCERIFGPVEDFYCSCERKGEKNEKFCPTCEVEFTKSRVRRIRMGYIPLAVPVVHVWYLRGRPSYIANLVGKSRNSIDRLAYGETLSESFIGYSSLESLYKKEDIHILEEENVFSKRLQDTSVAELRLPHYPLTPTGSGVLGNRSSATLDSCNDSSYKSSICTTHNKSSSRRCTNLRFVTPTKMNPNPLPVGYGSERVEGSWVHFSGANICTARVNPQRALYANSLQYPIPFTERACGGVRSTLEVTNLQPVPFVTAEKSIVGGSKAEKYPKEISFGHKQKYLKCHTLPLFSTFVYKEWAHRFSFLEYFTWSARNNDLVLPFYAYQNSKSKKRLSNICESLRKSAINLVRNKFSLRFSNKSNCNHSSNATLRQLNSFEVLSCKSSIYPPLKWTLTGSGVSMELRKEGVPLREYKYPPASTRVIAYPAKGKELPRNSEGTPHTLRSLRGLELCQRVVSTSLLAHPLLVNKSILQQQKVQPYFLQLRNKQGVLRVIKVKKDIGFLFHTKPNFYDICSQLRVQRKPLQGIKMNNNFINNDELPRNQCSVKGVMLTNSVTKLQSGHKTSVAELRLPPTKMNPGMGYSRGLKNCYAFSPIQQDTESTPLNKMDTQQFPRLIELLNFTGGAALRNLLSRFDLIVLSKFLRHELKNLELKVNRLLALKILTYSQGLLLGKLAKRRSKQIRRLKLLELFQSQKSNPEWMILSVIPVLPPDLRPILRVNDDFVVASDLNRLYQTVLRRNNTIHERLDDPLPCPESGLFRQRSLQKAVDGLLENGKGGGTPLCASKRRPLVSLSHVLKGKKGLFRQHLLGKRVDYSGRSVIVVGPRLQVHECGLPKEMAIELFQPFLLHRLKVKGLATSNTTARRMIQQGNPVIWHLLKQLIYEHPVLLNRAPTLHRLGIQAFQPRLVSGRAILLHPLVCNGFNADFDGDQMAVHVPLSFQARAEAWKIMWSKNNFLSPATGQPILVPSQDMVLGCYYLSVSIPRILNSAAELRLPPTKMNPLQSKALHGVRGTQSKHISKLGISTVNQNLHSKAFLNENKGQYFSNLQDSLLAYFQGRLQTHTPFWVRIDHKLARENSVNNNNSSDAYPLPQLRTPLTPSGSWGNGYERKLRSSATLGKSSICIPRVIEKPRAITNIRKMEGVSNVQNAYPIPLQGKQIHFSGALHRGKELTFLQPLYGSSRQICKALFQNKSANNFQIRVEANETLELPLELRLSIDGNLANILTMFQNYYNYNATWVKQCKEESIKYMRTTAGRVVINDVVFKDF